ncbi:MAG TPA: peptidoglycan DD-metalloendopeptidase family protein [Gaiellaceae bacterium]|jgi:murein DD-endopeptidase MepM/ murein hydrolase activator NlpD|nr:peptidoglycan DD-metalloendopeptidase family protein [Gaiellaceae bacterium]
MARLRRLAAIVVFLGVCLGLPAAALGIGSSHVAAIQVALRARHLYSGTVDGRLGRATAQAIVRAQRQAGLVPDGVPGPHTTAMLGPLAGPALGTRTLTPGAVGGDVVELQFLLAWHGFPNGRFDGGFGSHTEAALLRFQRWAHLPVTGTAGPDTVAALRAAVPTCPIRLGWPLDVPVGDHFGPRGDAFHPGIDLPAPFGTPVHAAMVGAVTFAGWTAGGYGNLVVVKGMDGVATMYAHLSRLLAWRGEKVTVGTLVGLVGATGETTGPHLHFEVRVRGAAVDPLPALR